MEIEGPSEVLTEVQADLPAEPLKEGTEMVSPNSLSSERTRSVGSEEISQPKTSEELVKEVTLSEKIIEKVVAHVGETVVDAADITLQSFHLEDVRSEEEKKTSEEESKGGEITFLNFLQDIVVYLLKYLDRKRERNLLTRLEKSREAYDEAVKRSERLITTTERREKKHVEELAKLEGRSAEEVRIAKELRGKIAEAKTAEEDLRSKILEIAGKCEMEFRRAEELSASLAEGVQKHEEELANWAKKLTVCESAKSSEVECKLKVESECRRLHEKLGKADMRLQELQRRMEKAEEVYCQLRDELKLRL
ncbi:hypothetical protein AXG93_4776s1080 [Marchantia polymorpha subsp. ruderalis]|uniref:Uncharacterized protein n=1 Tax=Marchantia polymorpha subsp. ruderalis TaxID=1480154 RepID=A0A176VV24_MARPO|nr:hypothetical protein AXG93_4776s1080 [Marchantia polymorpha subsp. ruderalis]